MTLTFLIKELQMKILGSIRVKLYSLQFININLTM